MQRFRFSLPWGQRAVSDPMTPDLYDARGGMIPERRHDVRREDDPDVDVLRGVNYWAKLVLVHKSKLIVLFTLAGTIGGYMAGCGRRLGDLDVVKADVTQLKGGLVAVEKEVVNLKGGQKLQQYIMCVSVPKNAPAEAHALCDAIVERGP